MFRIKISVEKHGSKHIAVIGHFDCAGNPAGEAVQRRHILKAVEEVKGRFGNADVIGLWADKNWVVTEIV